MNERKKDTSREMTESKVKCSRKRDRDRVTEESRWRQRDGERAREGKRHRDTQRDGG